MNALVWLQFGSIIGWIASLVMFTDLRHGVLMNITVGVTGALFGGWIISPLVGGATVNQSDFSAVGLMVSLGGAVLLLAIVNLIHRIASR